MPFTGHQFTEAASGPAAAFKSMGDGTEAQAVVPVIGVDPVSDGNPMPSKIVNAVLPTGASTEAKQDTGNTSLTNIEAKVATSADVLSNEAVLHHILRALQLLITRLPLPNAAQQMPVSAAITGGTVGISANSSVNVAQVGGQNTATGLGASGNGAARVTPASDTVAGNPQTWSFQQSLDTRNFRNRIVT